VSPRIPAEIPAIDDNEVRLKLNVHNKTIKSCRVKKNNDKKKKLLWAALRINSYLLWIIKIRGSQTGVALEVKNFVVLHVIWLWLKISSVLNSKFVFHHLSFVIMNGLTTENKMMANLLWQNTNAWNVSFDIFL